MKTMAELMAQDEAKLKGEWCGSAKVLHRKSAVEQYNKLPIEYFLSPLRHINRPKAMEVVQELGGQVAAALEDSNPSKARLQELAAGNNAMAHKAWYYSTRKIGKEIPIEMVMVGTLARILLQEDLEPTVAANTLLVGYIELTRSFRKKHEGKTHDQVTAELKTWLHSKVTEEEFCQGLT